MSVGNLMEELGALYDKHNGNLQEMLKNATPAERAEYHKNVTNSPLGKKFQAMAEDSDSFDFKV